MVCIDIFFYKIELAILYMCGIVCYKHVNQMMDLYQIWHYDGSQHLEINTSAFLPKLKILRVDKNASLKVHVSCINRWW